MKYLKNIKKRWLKEDLMKIPLKTVLMLFVVVGLMCAFAQPANASIIRECGSQDLCEDPVVGCGGVWKNHYGDPDWPYVVLNACHIEGKVWTDNSHIIARGSLSALVGPFTTHFDEAITGVAVAGFGPIIDATVLGPVATAFVLSGSNAMCIRCVAGAGSERPFTGVTLAGGARLIDSHIETRSRAATLAGDGAAIVGGSLRTSGRSTMIDMSPGIKDGYVGGVTLGPTFDNPGRAGNYIIGRGDVHFDNNDASGADMGIAMFEGEMTVTDNIFADTGNPHPLVSNGVIMAFGGNASAQVANNQFIDNYDSDYDLERAKITSLPEQAEDRKKMLRIMNKTSEKKLDKSVAGKGGGSKQFVISRKLRNSYGFVLSQENKITHHVDDLAEAASAYEIITESALQVEVALGEKHVGNLTGVGQDLLLDVVIQSDAGNITRQITYDATVAQGSPALLHNGEALIRAAFGATEALAGSIRSRVEALGSATDFKVTHTRGDKIARLLYINPQAKSDVDKPASLKLNKKMAEGVLLAQEAKAAAKKLDCTVTDEYVINSDPVWKGTHLNVRMLDADAMLLQEATIKMGKSAATAMSGDLLSVSVERAVAYGKPEGRETGIEVVADDANFSINTWLDSEFKNTAASFKGKLFTGTMTPGDVGQYLGFVYEEAARLQSISFHANASFNKVAQVDWIQRSGNHGSATYTDSDTVDDILADLTMKISFPYSAEIKCVGCNPTVRIKTVVSSCATGSAKDKYYSLDCVDVGQAYYVDTIDGNAIFKILLPDTGESLMTIVREMGDLWSFFMISDVAKVRNPTLRVHPIGRPKKMR